MTSMFRWKKKEASDGNNASNVEESLHNKNLEELKSKFGDLGVTRTNNSSNQQKGTNSGAALIQDAMSTLRGTIAPLKGSDGDQDHGDGPPRARSKTDGVKNNSKNMFAEAISDLGNLAREASQRKEKHVAIAKKRNLLNKLDRCRKLTTEANEIAEEVQAYITFRVRLVSAIEDTPAPVVVKPPPPPPPAAHEGGRPTFSKALSFAVRPSDHVSSSSSSTPTSQPRKFGKYVAASSFITRAANAATNHRADDALHRKLVEGTISQAEYNAIKQKMKEAGDMDGIGGNGLYNGDSDDSDGENEAVNAEMESVLDSAVSHERMSVVAQCYCRLPRREVLKTTGRVLGWGSGPAIITTSASWPQFIPVHAHFAPPASCLPKPRGDEDEDSEEEGDDFEEGLGEEALLELRRGSSSSSLMSTSSLKRENSSSSLKRGGSSSSLSLKRDSSSRKMKGPKKSISFGDAQELESTDTPKRKAVGFAVNEEESAPVVEKGVKFGVGFADEPSSSPSKANTGSSLKRKSKERRRSIDLAPGAALEAARHDLQEMMGEAMKLVMSNQVKLKKLQVDTEGAPPHLAKQLTSLMPLAERDVKVLEDLRAQYRAVSETIRGFSDTQKQQAADLLLQFGRKRVVETSNIDKEAMKLEAMNVTQSIMSKKNVEEDQELVLFEVECDTMDDVLRSLQRFRFNVRRVVKKGNQAKGSSTSGAAMAAASAAMAMVASESGVQLGESKWQLEEAEEELRQLLSLSSLTKEQRLRCEYLQSHTTDKARRRSVAINATMAAAEAVNTVSNLSSAASAAAAVAAQHFGSRNDDEDEDFDSRLRRKTEEEAKASEVEDNEMNAISDVTSSLRLLFRAVDTDGSGEIDAEELSAAMTELGLVDHDDRSTNIGGKAITIFEAFDRDQSGSLEFDEFERLIRNRLHRNAIQPFVTHEAAYSALLRYLGIDIPTFESPDLSAFESVDPKLQASNMASGMTSPRVLLSPKTSQTEASSKSFDSQDSEEVSSRALALSTSPRASLTRAIGAPPLPRTANTRARRIAHAANIGNEQQGTVVRHSKRRPSMLSTPRSDNDPSFLAYAAVAAFPLAAANAAHLEKDKDAALNSPQSGKRVSVMAPAALPRVSSVKKLGGNQERMMTDAAAQVRLGHKSLKQRRYGTALEWFSLAASQGNAEGQFEVARMMDKGLGLATDGRDLVGAVSWYDAAARGGEARAMFKLAMLFRDGEGVEKDLDLSEQWMKLAAESGIAAAQDNLATKLFHQAAVLPPKHRENMVSQAMEWLKRSAAQGLGHSLLELGKRHMKGEDGVEMNHELSAKLFEQVCSAASIFPPQSSTHDIGGDMFYDANLRGSSINDNDSDSQSNVANQSNNNHDPWEGQSPYEATLTVAEAEYHLACCYRDGTGVGLSETLGALWMERAADHGYSDAMFDLSFMIAHGYGCLTADPVVAVQWLRSADDIGHDKASRLLQKQRKLLFEDGEEGEVGESGNGGSSNALAHANVSLSFQEKVKRRLSVVELAAALDEFVEAEEEEEEAAILLKKKQERKEMSSDTSITEGIEEGGDADFEDDGSCDELEDGSGDEFDEIVTDDVQDRISESLSVGDNLGLRVKDSPDDVVKNRFAKIRASFVNPVTHTAPRRTPSILGVADLGSISDEFSSSPTDSLNRLNSGLNWNMGAGNNSAIVGMGGGGPRGSGGSFNSVNPLLRKSSGSDRSDADSKQALLMSQALVKLRLIETSLAEQHRQSQKSFDILAGFEADRRDSVEKKFLGSGSNISKLQGVNGGGFSSISSASSNNLNSLKGLSMRYPVSRGGGGGGMSSGMGLLTLLGAEGTSGLSSLFSLLQAAESADVKAYDRLETLGDAWTQTSQSEIQTSQPTITGSSSSQVEEGPAYARALAVALGELGYHMAEEARQAADAVAELGLPCESAKLSLQARSNEVIISVNSSVQAATGSNTQVRVAWAAVADQHKLSNRRRHADISKIKRNISLASSPSSLSGANATKQCEDITNIADTFKASTPDGDGGGGCKWLALRNYRVAIKEEYRACEVASVELKSAYVIASELREAAVQVERDIVVLALQARIRELASVSKQVRLLRLQHLEKMDSSQAMQEPLSVKGSDSQASILGAEKMAGISAGNSWSASEWSEERVGKEAAAVRRILIPFVKDAILERCRLLLSALDLDTNGDRASLSFFDSSTHNKGNNGKSKRSNLLCGSYDKALLKSSELIEAWGSQAELLISELPGVHGSAGGEGGTSNMTSSLMLKRMSMSRRTNPTAATVPAEILASLELCLCECLEVFKFECDKIYTKQEKKSSFIRPEDHAISSLTASSKDANDAAQCLLTPITGYMERSSLETDSSDASMKNTVLKRSSAVWLLLQSSSSRYSVVNGKEPEDSAVLRSGALVLTSDGFLHVFMKPESDSSADLEEEEKFTTTFGTYASKPPPLSFLETCLFTNQGGDDSGSSLIAPTLSVFMSADPTGRRTAVNKMKSGIFRLHITEPDVEASEGQSMGATQSTTQTLHTLSLPSALQPNNSKSAASVEGVIVAVDSDDSANDWIEDLLRAAIR